MKKYALLSVLLAFTVSAYSQKQKLSLNEAIDLGLTNNPEMISSSEKINSAKGRFWSGIALAPPELSFSYEYIPLGKDLQKFGERTIELQQSIEFPTNYFLRGSKLETEIEITENEHNLNELNVIFRIKRAYVDMLASQELLKNAEENLSIARDFYEKAEIRYGVGEGTNLEKLTAKVQYTEALNNVDVQKNEVTSALAVLNYAIGNIEKEFKDYNLTDSLEYLPSIVDIEKIPSSSNSIIKINELRVNAFSIDKKLAWSSILPQLNLAYFRQTLGEDNGYYGASLGISIPIWFMFDHRGRIEEATANLKTAESELQSFRNEVSVQIKTAFSSYINGKKQYELHRSEIIPESEEIFRIASLSYESGEITYLEFLQAKQILTNARINYINSLLSFNKSILLLEEAVGIRLI